MEAWQLVLGQELHDNLGQQLAAISYQAKALEKRISLLDDAEAAKIAASISVQAQRAVQQCKQLAQGMLPFELEQNGLLAALQALATRIATIFGMSCRIICEDKVFIDDAAMSLNLYRIAQEAINNAIRHGGAKHLTITLTWQQGNLFFSICDDGVGFTCADPQSDFAGMGIKIMRYRAKQLGATLKFLTCAEGGTEVRIERQMA